MEGEARRSCEGAGGTCIGSITSAEVVGQREEKNE